jgi:hypothetical protein
VSYLLTLHLNGEEYLIFLQNVLSDLLQVLENRWIGRNGPVLWPARSTDLSPCDFFMGPFKTNCL